LPPLPENFGVSHEILYKFLTEPPKSEPQDIYDRKIRKLIEPKSVINLYKESQDMTVEQKYHSAQTLLHQWLSEYAKKDPTKPTSHLVKVHTAAIELDLQTQNLCFEKIKEIMELHYSDIKNTPVFKLIQKNLEEVSKDYIKCLHYPLNKKSVDKFHSSQKALLSNLGLVEQSKIKSETELSLKQNFISAMNFKISPQDYRNPVVHYKMHPNSEILPKICEDSNGLDLPLQQFEYFQPYETKKVNLGIKFQLPENHCALLMNKSSARTKYKVNIQLGLIDIGYHDFVIAVIQNMTDEPIMLDKGTAVAQLLLLPSKIPSFAHHWPISNSTRGGFGSTGQNFETLQTDLKTNHMTVLNSMEE
jgi:dUTPase